MSQPPPIHLIVDADGVLQVLDKVEGAFEDAGQSAERAAKANARYAKSTAEMISPQERLAAAMAKMRDAQERQVAMMVQSPRRVEAEWNKIEASIDRFAALRNRQNRESARFARAASDAVVLGLSNEAEARQRAIALEQRHRAEMEKLASVQKQAAATTTRLAVANDNSAGYRRQNLGFQLQDIGVSLYGGMPVGTVLMQQGSQIAGIYGGAGGVNAALKDFTAILGAAIRFIGPFAAAGAAAYGIYKIFAANTVEARFAVDDLTKALAEQAAPLDSLRSQVEALTDIQRAYNQAIRDSATASTDATATIIANSEREYNARKSLLELEQKRQQALLATQQAEMQGLQLQLRGEIAKSVTTRNDLQAQGYSDPRIGSVPFVRVPDSVTGVEKVKDIIEKSALADRIKELRANMALTEIGAEKLADALKKPFEVEPYGTGDLPITGPMPTPDPRKALDYDGETKQVDRLKASYSDLIFTAQKRIEQMRGELALVGASGFANQAYRQEQDLLSQAIENAAGKLTDITDAGERWRKAQEMVTPAQREEIHRLAQEYGNLTQSIAEATLKADLMFERSQQGRSPVEQRVATELRGIYGTDYQSKMNGAIAGQIRLNEQWRTAQDELKAIGDLGRDALGGLLDILYQSGDATEKLLGLFANIGKNFAQLALSQIMECAGMEGTQE